jgi:hypothetical protein
MSPGLDIRLHLLNSFLFKNSKLLIHPHDEPVTSHQAPRGGGRGARGVGWGECCAGTHQGSSLRHEGQALHLPRGASLEGDHTLSLSTRGAWWHYLATAFLYLVTFSHWLFITLLYTFLLIGGPGFRHFKPIHCK